MFFSQPLSHFVGLDCLPYGKSPRQVTRFTCNFLPSSQEKGLYILSCYTSNTKETSKVS